MAECPLCNHDDDSHSFEVQQNGKKYRAVYAGVVGPNANTIQTAIACLLQHILTEFIEMADDLEKDTGEKSRIILCKEMENKNVAN